jgi:hypothetical protein
MPKKVTVTEKTYTIIDDIESKCFHIATDLNTENPQGLTMFMHYTDSNRENLLELFHETVRQFFLFQN